MTISREDSSTSRAALWTESVTDIPPHGNNEWPGNVRHPKHFTYGFVQSAAVPELAARQEKGTGTIHPP